MRTLSRQWLVFGTKNPQADEALYELVAKTFNNKLEEQDFEDVVNELGNNLDPHELYTRYEDLTCFLSYLKRNGISI